MVVQRSVKIKSSLILAIFLRNTNIISGQFDIARKFAVIVGFNTADVILKQMRNQLTRFKDSPLWLTIKARYNFWALTSNRLGKTFLNRIRC